MDQLEILQKLEKLLQAYEASVNKHYARLEKQIEQLLQQYYDAYGENLSDWLKYDRLTRFKQQIDKYAAAQYKAIKNDVETAENDAFNVTYFMYAYLFYMVMSEDEGQLTKITTAGVKTSAAVAVAYWLLKNRKVLFDTLKNERISLSDVFQKHKDDYVYSVINDVRDNLKSGAEAKVTKEKIQKRSLNVKYYGINRLRDVWNLAINYAQDKVYDALKPYGGVEKLWISMKDSHVRLAHRILDGQFADNDGWFHYAGDKARRPKGFVSSALNWGCRCKLFIVFNGKLPKTSAIYDYRDDKYLKKLDKHINELQKQGKTYIQAMQQAQKDIRPPRRTLPYFITYEDWFEEYGPSD